MFCVFLSQAAQLQTRYIELITLSGDYYKFLGELLKNMEELKVLILYFMFFQYLRLLSTFNNFCLHYI